MGNAFQNGHTTIRNGVANCSNEQKHKTFIRLVTFFLVFFPTKKRKEERDPQSSHCLITTQNVVFLIFDFSILAFSTRFCFIKSDMSGNTVWSQASGFQKLTKIDDLWHLLHSKCKCSSLRSQCWMRLFLWFSNTVVLTPVIYVDQNESFGGLSNSLKELLENGNLLVIFWSFVPQSRWWK